MGRVSIVLIVAAVGSLAILAMPAMGAVSHSFATYFGAGTSTPANPYPLSEPSDVAVDNSNSSSAHDVYVTDPTNHRVEKFDSSGQFILMFGQEVNETTGGDVCTAASGDTCRAGVSGPSPGGFEAPTLVAVDSSSGPSAGDVYVGDTGDNLVSKFDPSGDLLTTWGGGQLGGFGRLGGLAVDASGTLLVVGAQGKFNNEVFYYSQSGQFLTQVVTSGICSQQLTVNAEGNLYELCNERVIKFTDTGKNLGEPTSGASGLTIDPTSDELYVDQNGESISHFGLDDSFLDSFGSGQLAEAHGLSIDGVSSRVYVANTAANNVAVFDSAVPEVTTGTPSNFTQTSATISGQVDPAGRGPITECYFEYGTDTGYESGDIPCEPLTPYAVATPVTADLSGLRPATTYHFRLVASNSVGTAHGKDQTVSTTQAPTVESFLASHLTATTADLEAKINPQGLNTEYHFEYGTTAEYGTSVPSPEKSIGAGEAGQHVEVHVSGLQSGAVYHFRVVAHNSLGTATSEDQTFNFLPANCPNSAVRQQTKTTFLPDCRAYELVSAANANGVILSPYSPLNSPYADNSFAYKAFGGIIPNSGNPENGETFDTYSAVRTSAGWVTKYVGIPGTETSSGSTTLTDRAMDRFLAIDNRSFYDDGTISGKSSAAPYVYAPDGSYLGQWPSNIGNFPGGNKFVGALQPSPDFSHLAFSSNNVAFAPGGLTVAPGSAYDFNTTTNTITLISKDANGADIKQEAGNTDETEAIGFGGAGGQSNGKQWYPPVSVDGSHILMSTAGSGGSHLYMRVDDAVTYDVSKGRTVHFLGMSADGTKVFFSSAQQLTPEDTDTSTDIYMWSEATDALTDITLGSNGAGNADNCEPVGEWTSGCGVLMVTGGQQSDNALAADGGTLYFYSPEQLDGASGTLGLQNLYMYSDGQVRYIKTFAPEENCAVGPDEEEECGNGALERIQVSPAGDHMAFVTRQRVTGYDNDHREEMYTYTPATRALVCVSCIPDGSAPKSNVSASSGILFMSDDGRTVFYTSDALVPQDTDKIHDVYEYVDGRPQLITSGIGLQDSVSIHDSYSEQTRTASLSGITADGVNIFFDTYDTLVPQDENGNFLKYYDARTNGGFPYVPSAAPCQAADECHGAGNPSPPPPQVESEVALGAGGNLSTSIKTVRREKKHRHRRNSRQRRRAARIGGGHQ